ncbi:MAG: hypothetical protein RLZZ01_1954 [Actinomycetota bacterium]
MLTVIGDLVEDIVVWTAGPTRRGTDNTSVITRRRGGSAANVAAHAAGSTEVRFIGRVGTDPVGERLVAALGASGVEVRAQRGGRTGTVVVMVDSTDGERTMFPDRAAAAELGPVDPTWLVDTSVLHVPAYGLATEPAATSILEAVDSVHASGGAVSFDLSAVTLVEWFGPDRLVSTLLGAKADLVFANSEEAASCDLARLVEGGSIVVVKNGADPAVVSTRSGIVRVDALPVEGVLDTTGAGDAFAAGFLADWAIHRDPVAACRSAHRLAATVLHVPGAG